MGKIMKLLALKGGACGEPLPVKAYKPSLKDRTKTYNDWCIGPHIVSSTS